MCFIADDVQRNLYLKPVKLISVWADEAWLPADPPVRLVDAPHMAPGRGGAFLIDNH